MEYVTQSREPIVHNVPVERQANKLYIPRMEMEKLLKGMRAYNSHAVLKRLEKAKGKTSKRKRAARDIIFFFFFFFKVILHRRPNL